GGRVVSSARTVIRARPSADFHRRCDAGQRGRRNSGSVSKVMNLLLSVLLLLAPVKSEHGRFNVIKDGQRIGTEEFTIAARGKTYVLDGKATLGDVTITSKMELDDKLVPISYEVSNQAGKMKVNVASPISELQTVVGGETSSADFRFPERGV